MAKSIVMEFDVGKFWEKLSKLFGWNIFFKKITDSRINTFVSAVWLGNDVMLRGDVSAKSHASRTWDGFHTPSPLPRGSKSRVQLYWPCYATSSDLSSVAWSLLFVLYRGRTWTSWRLFNRYFYNHVLTYLQNCTSIFAAAPHCLVHVHWSIYDKDLKTTKMFSHTKLLADVEAVPRYPRYNEALPRFRTPVTRFGVAVSASWYFRRHISYLSSLPETDSCPCYMLKIIMQWVIFNERRTHQRLPFDSQWQWMSRNCCVILKTCFVDKALNVLGYLSS